MSKLILVLSLALFFSSVCSDECADGVINQPFYTYSDSMGCVYAEPLHRYDNYDDALRHCKEIFGDKAQLAEILSADDQATVLPVMLAAEATVTENPEISYWFSGLRDEDDDGVWEWVNGGPATYLNWNPRAVPNHASFNCMQLLSATGSDGSWMTFLCSDDYINTHPLCQLPN